MAVNRVDKGLDFSLGFAGVTGAGLLALFCKHLPDEFNRVHVAERAEFALRPRLVERRRQWFTAREHDARVWAGFEQALAHS
jgi:hypothetical protein